MQSYLKVIEFTKINRENTYFAHSYDLGANPGVYYKLVFTTYEQIL